MSDIGLKCTVPGCKKVIVAWTGLQELMKLRQHMARAHRANWNMDQALNNRVIMENKNEKANQ